MFDLGRRWPYGWRLLRCLPALSIHWAVHSETQERNSAQNCREAIEIDILNFSAGVPNSDGPDQE